MSEEKIQRTYATLLKSQVDIIRSFPEDQQLKLLWMLIDYELEGKEPDLEPSHDGLSAVQIFWMMSQPLADSRTRKALNGRKGGRPTTKAEENQIKTEKNQTKPKKTENNRKKPKQTEAKAEKEKETDMEKDTDTSPSGASHSLSGGACPEGWDENDGESIPEGWTEDDEMSFQEQRYAYKTRQDFWNQWSWMHNDEGDDDS